MEELKQFLDDEDDFIVATVEELLDVIKECENSQLTKDEAKEIIEDLTDLSVISMVSKNEQHKEKLIRKFEKIKSILSLIFKVIK